MSLIKHKLDERLAQETCTRCGGDLITDNEYNAKLCEACQAELADEADDAEEPTDGY